MNIQTIKSLDGQEYVLLPLSCYKGLKPQIDKYLAKQADLNEYVPFVLEDYISNPVAIARINAGITQKELAKMLKVSQAYISKLEASARVSAKTILKIKTAIQRYNN